MKKTPRLDEVFPMEEAAGGKLFSLETPGHTFVVMAKGREEAIVFLSGIVGKQYIVQHRDQVQQHLGPVVQVDHQGQADVVEPEAEEPTA